MCGAVWYALDVLSMGDDHKKGLFLWSSPIGVHGLHCSDELMWEQHVVHIKLEPFPLYLTFIYELLFMKHVLLSWSAASLFLVMTSSVVLVCSFVLLLFFALPVAIHGSPWPSMDGVWFPYRLLKQLNYFTLTQVNTELISSIPHIVLRSYFAKLQY